jgi:hypothetical protein
MSTVISSRKGIGGPKTPEGKARSSRNAIKHGLTSREPVLLAHESREAWEQFSRDFVESLHPAGADEIALAREMALTLWRSRRASVYQAALTAAALRDAERRAESEARNLRLSPEARARQLELLRAETVLPAGPQFERLLKYEARLDRQFDRLFRRYFKLQAIREKASAAGPNASPNLTLTQQPTSLEPEIDKTNSAAPTDLTPPTSEATSQTDKTNSPTTEVATHAPATAQIDKTNSPTAQSTTGAPRPSSEVALQTDKTNSPSSRVTNEPAPPASRATQIDKTNSPPSGSPRTQRLPLPPPRKPTKRTPRRRRRP